MIFKNNKTYDILSILSRVVLPLSVLVASLGDIWNIPLCKPISLTLGAIDVFIGSLLIDSKRKYDELIQVNDDVD